jgi:hypothetical protein
MTTTEKVSKMSVEKASAYDEGYTTDGSDGNHYVVKADKQGVKKWVKQKNDDNKTVEPTDDSDNSDNTIDNPKTPESKNRADNTDEKLKAPKKIPKKKVDKNVSQTEEEEKPKAASEGKKKKEKSSAASEGKKAVDESKPKRKPTPYINFIKIMLPKLREQQPGEKSTTYMTMAGSMWKGLSDDEKKTYAPVVV